MKKIFQNIKSQKIIFYTLLLLIAFFPIQYLLKMSIVTYFNKGSLGVESIKRIEILSNNLVYYYLFFALILLLIIRYKEKLIKLFDRLLSLRVRQIVFFAFIIRILWMVVFPTGPVSDFIQYNNLSVEYAKTGNFSFPSIPFLPVGSIYIFALIYKIFGIHLVYIKIFQLLLSVFTIFIFYKITYKLFDHRVAKVFILLYAFYPAHISMINITAPEIIMTFLFACFIFLFLYLKDTWYKNIFLGICAGMLLYIKPVFIFSLFVPLLINLFKKQYKQTIANLLIPIISFLLIMPFCNRYKHIFLVDTNGGINLLMGNNMKATGSYFSPSQIKELEKIDLNQLSTFEKDRVFKKIAMNFIIKHPGKFIGLIPKRLFFLLFKDTSALTLSFTGLNSPNILKSVLYVFNLIYYYFILFGALCYLRWKYIKDNFQQFLIIVGYILSVVSIFMISFGMDRYKYPVMPLVIILSGLWMSFLTKKHWNSSNQPEKSIQ